MTKNRKGSKGKGVLAAVFLIPLAFIVYYFIIYSSQSITLENVNKVTVSVSGTEDTVFDSQQDIDFYVDMLNGSLSINSAMRDVSGESPVYITCNREDRAVEYKFYPSLNLSGCLLVAPEGQLYVLQNETAKQLLLRDEFAYLYSSYFLPELSLVSGVESVKIPPVSSEWSYYKSDGAAYTYTPSEYSAGTELYTIYNGFENKLQFSQSDILPYELTEVYYVSEDGTEHNVKDVSQLEFSVDTIVSISFTAKWSARNGAQASGQAKYVFNVLYDIPSVLELDGSEYTWGDIIEINASNLNHDEVVNLETLLKNKGIKFSDLGEGEGIALIPVGIENAPGQYTVSIMTDVGGISESITVSEKESGDWVPFSITNEEYESMLSLDKMTAFEQALADLTASRPEKDYFSYNESKLHSPVDSDYIYGYGQSINLGVTDITGDSGERTVKGVVYELDEGDTVSSAQAGKVVFSGNLAPTGNTVIIYHGYGIYSYYYHLESASVKAGDEVEDGQTVGIAGSTGYTNGKTVLHYAISIDGIFVNPDWFE